MEFSDSLGDCLVAARSAATDAAKLSADEIDDERLHWLEMQLSSVILELQLMLADIESGLSIRNMGFSSEDDFETLIDGFRAEIASLKGQIRGVMLGKGR